MDIVYRIFRRIRQDLPQLPATIGSLVLSLFVVPSAALACAVLVTDKNGHQHMEVAGSTPSPSLAPPPPVISGEQAVIIWDDVHKIEHFIRQANIDTAEPELGFLVPTPQTPELVEADASIFEQIAIVAEPEKVPEIVYETPLEMMRRIANGFAATKSIFTTISAQLAYAGPGPREVQVVHEQDVAHYHAAVLAADDAAALAKWLKDNGYAWSEDATAWLRPYVEAKWKITAFKLLKPSTDPYSTSLDTHAIRMSFAADHPFFPYSEPGDTNKGQPASPNGRSLTVAVLSNERMSGTLANGKAWPGELQYGSVLSSEAASQILTLSKLDDPKYQMTRPSRLTYFRDTSNPRPGTADLYFSPNADQSLMRKTEIDYSLPKEYRFDFSHPFSDLVALLIVLAVVSPIAYLLIWNFRRPPEEPTMPRTY